MEIDKLSLPEFIRYGLTGFNALVWLFLTPILIMKPDIFPILLNTSTIIGITLFALVLGFLLDTLKLYQLSFGYKAKREKFLQEFAKKLKIEDWETSSFFSLTTQMSKQMNKPELEIRQAQWILADHTAKVFFIGTVVLLILFFFYTNFWNHQRIFLIIAIACYIFCMIRLFYIRKIERIKSDKNYLIFARDNREKIINGWK
jgi:hypothetical protein